MGSVNFGAPRALIKQLRETFDVSTFVETGTHLGETSAWASNVFRQVITVEGSEDYHREAKQRHADRTNIEFLLGDSRTRLAEILQRLNEPALFWLDAHWMGAGSLATADVFGRGSECPLLDEIALINASKLDHIVLIDDARLFLAPPPLPHRADEWPNIKEVLAALDMKDTGWRTIVYDDVMTCAPLAYQAQVQEIFQQIVTIAPYGTPATPLPLLKRIELRLRRLLSLPE